MSRLSSRAGEVQAVLFALYGSSNALTGNITLTEIFEGLQSAAYPFTPLFFVFVRFKKPKGSEFRVAIRVQDAEGTLPWQFPENEVRLAPDQASVQLLVQANPIFPKPGIYQVVISVDGVDIASEELKTQLVNIPVTR